VPIHDYGMITVQNLPFAKRKLEIPGMTTDAWTIANATPLRTLDVATATPTDALNAIAALVADLKASGVLPP